MIGLSCLCSTFFRKGVAVFSLFSFFTVLFNCMCRDQSFSAAHRTTHCKHARKNLSIFHFCEYNSLACVCAKNYKLNRNGNFCKGTKVDKIIAGAKVFLVSYNKKIHWFFSHVCNSKFATFWVLCLRDNL